MRLGWQKICRSRRTGEPPRVSSRARAGVRQVLERDWRSIFRVHLDDVEKYGLEQPGRMGVWL